MIDRRPALAAMLLMAGLAPAAMPEQAQALPPAVTQAEYEKAMWCIGRNEGDMAMAQRVMPPSANAHNLPEYLESNKPLEEAFARMMDRARDPAQDLDIPAGEAARARGRLVYDQHRTLALRDQYGVWQSLSWSGEGCTQALGTALNSFDAYAAARGKAEASRN